MTFLKIYPGDTGMQRSLLEIDLRFEQLSLELRQLPPARDPQAMFHLEQQRLQLARSLADLLSARDLVLAHLDPDFLEHARQSARQPFRERGLTLRSRGWKWRRILFQSGLVLELKTPFFVVPPSRRGQPRSKRGRKGKGCLPVLERLGITDGVSPATRSEISRQTVLLSSYQEAREQLARGGLHVQRTTLRRIAVRTGRRALEHRAQSLERARQAPLPDSSVFEGKTLRVSLDGGRARTRKTERGRGIRPGKNGRRPFTLEWREPRLITIDVLDDEGKTDRHWRPIYEVSLGEADQVFSTLANLLRLIGANKAGRVIFLADGASWIWKRIEKLIKDAGLDPERFLAVLDYYHATEQVWEAVEACKGMKSKERLALFEKLKNWLLEEGGLDKVIECLRGLARGRRAKKVDKKIRYLEKQRARMNYADLWAENLPIGSGVVESAIRRVVNLRFKSASMCWVEENLEGLLYLRAVIKAGWWDEFMLSWLADRYVFEGRFTSTAAPESTSQAA